MKKFNLLLAVWLSMLYIGGYSQQKDVILQGFYWNSHPGDVTDNLAGGIWWDSLNLVAAELGAAGFQTVWTPPPTKGFSGLWDMGYGIKDYYDLGKFNQNGSIRTRHGNENQFKNMVASLHASGLNVMADLVLNHRGGADGQNLAYDYSGGIFLGIQPWTVFNPASGRVPGDSSDFHPSQFHPDQNADYHNAIFFEDMCYFNNGDIIPPPGGWFYGPPNALNIGPIGDSLIGWGRWLVNDLGIDELRLDAVKHIDPWFLAKFLVEMREGTQPFAVGESFDYSPLNLQNYHKEVINSPNSGAKTAALSMFDFPLRANLKAILNNGSGGEDLYNTLGGAGLVWGSSLNGLQVVTWLENHDTDRIGFEGGTGTAPCTQPGDIQFGNSCLKITGETSPDHDPVVQDKEDIGYPFLMAAEGRPMVFWKDWFWFGLAEDIEWQMALRLATAQGASDHIQNMNGFWPTTSPFDGDNNGGNMFAMRRDGLTGGTADGMILGLNDHPTKTNGVWVNTPFQNKHLKDYSDAYLFESSQAFSDSRALIKAGPRDYSWWSATGLYPYPVGIPDSYFTMDAQPGGAPHFIALDAGDALNFTVNGGPIEAGDEIAVLNSAGEVVGIGRIGQEFGWNGVHDMLVEAIGPFPTDADPVGGAANGLALGENFRLMVRDAGSGQIFEASIITYASVGAGFTFNPKRPDSPNRNGSFSSFAMTTNEQGAFAANGISRILSFNADLPFPVDLLAFSASVDQQDILLQWTTAQELNNQGFEVQMKKLNGPDHEFSPLGFVAGVGTNPEKSHYQFRMKAPGPGTYFFRLKQVDMDGRFEYSHQVTATIVPEGASPFIFPNPVNDKLQVRFALESTQPVRIDLYDHLGRNTGTLFTGELEKGISQIQLDMADIPPGFYLLKIQEGRNSWRERFVKE